MSEYDPQQYDPREGWSRVARDLDSGRLHYGDDSPFESYWWRTLVNRFLHPLAAAVTGKDVLEVGCGPGGNLRMLLENAPRRLVGCDIAPPMIERASRQSQGLGIEYVVVDGRSLPFGDAEFDLAFTMTVLQHSPDRLFETTLAEMCRVTKSYLCVIEEMFPRPRVSHAFFGRTPADYTERVTAHGWTFVSAEVLPVWVSEQICGALVRRLQKRKLEFGESVNKATILAQRAALRLTRLLDPVILPDHGLTKVVFKRQ
jgi:ubiquinone/menaquinone biosynthesis C-methylase UbiE